MDLAAGIYLFEAQNQIPPPLTHCIRVYLFTQGRGGGESWTREKVKGATVHKAGSKYQHDWLYLQSINSNKHLPQSSFPGQSFRWRHFALVSTYLIVVLYVLYLNGLLHWLDSWTRSSGRPTGAHIAPGAHCQRRLKTTENPVMNNWTAEDHHVDITLAQSALQMKGCWESSLVSIFVLPEMKLRGLFISQCCGTVTIFTVPVPVPTFEKLWFRFRFRLLKNLWSRFRFLL